MTPTTPSRTAEWVCIMRAVENLRAPDSRVLADPYAHWFLSKPSRKWLGAVDATQRAVGTIPLMMPGLATFVAARHRFMDDALQRALRDPGFDQVVVLGAGYDARAWRFAEALAGRPVFEVDHPATSARKQRILQRHRAELPASNVHHVQIDFETQRLQDVLAAAGFRKGGRTFFTWEGVSMYLTRAAIKGTLGTLAGLGGPGSELVMDYWQLLDHPDPVGTAHCVSAGLLHLLGEPITFALHPEEGPDFLRRNDWTALDVADAAELGRRYLKDGRLVYPATWVTHARSG